MLINLMVNRLLPMFLKAAGGDPDAARMIVTETVNAHCARNATDVLAIAQIIACGMASLDNIILSMADDISRALRLRLQSAANAMNRSVEQNRRFLQQIPPEPANAWYGPEPDDAALEATAMAAVAEAQQYIAQTRAQQAAAQPAEAPERIATPAAEIPAPAAETLAAAKTGAPDLTEQQKAMIWAQGMNRVAAEYKASIPHLPPAQRREASLRAAALTSTANALIAGVPPDPFLLPKTPRTS
jgi:hypothetical protein